MSESSSHSFGSRRLSQAEVSISARRLRNAPMARRFFLLLFKSYLSVIFFNCSLRLPPNMSKPDNKSTIRGDLSGCCLLCGRTDMILSSWFDQPGLLFWVQIAHICVPGTV